MTVNELKVKLFDLLRQESQYSQALQAIQTEKAKLLEELAKQEADEKEPH